MRQGLNYQKFNCIEYISTHNFTFIISSCYSCQSRLSAIPLIFLFLDLIVSIFHQFFPLWDCCLKFGLDICNLLCLYYISIILCWYIILIFICKYHSVIIYLLNCNCCSAIIITTQSCRIFSGMSSECHLTEMPPF